MNKKSRFYNQIEVIVEEIQSECALMWFYARRKTKAYTIDAWWKYVERSGELTLTSLCYDGVELPVELFTLSTSEHDKFTVAIMAERDEYRAWWIEQYANWREADKQYQDGLERIALDDYERAASL